MKILMLGHGGLNAHDRREAFQALGHEVTGERLYQAADGRIANWLYRWAVHTKRGPWIDATNREIVERARQWQNFDLVWMEKAQYVWPETVAIIRQQVGCPVVHYTPDIALEIKGTQNSPIFHRAIPRYDLVITTKHFEIQSYKDKGANRVLYMEQAINHSRFMPCTNLDEQYHSQIGFIGRYEKHYAEVLRYAAQSGFSVDVRGPGWNKRRIQLDPRFSALRPRGPVRGKEYTNRLSGMEVGLGLLGKLGADLFTTRSIEIPACGTFLLAERTWKHREMYEEGVEAEFFADKQELVEKARYYLDHPEIREHIARAGYHRFLASEYRLDRQLERVLAELGRALQLRDATD